MPPKAKKVYKAPANLRSLRDAMEKRYGDSVVRVADRSPLEFIPTGVTSLDVGLGGGWARGRYHQVVGHPHHGVAVALLHGIPQGPQVGGGLVDLLGLRGHSGAPSGDGNGPDRTGRP